MSYPSPFVGASTNVSFNLPCPILLPSHQVLELCDDVQREMMLSRVRLQLHALKKYTYGKHIVARVEKLLATGTKLQSSSKHTLIVQPPLPDDSELPVLQQLLALQQQKKHSLDGKPGVAEADPGTGHSTPSKDEESQRVSSEAGAVRPVPVQ